MDFVSNYTKAETFKDKAMCYIAKMLGAHVITPLGRIVLLPEDYKKLAIETGNEDFIQDALLGHRNCNLIKKTRKNSMLFKSRSSFM